LNHDVLKKSRAIHSRDFTGQGVPDGEVLRAPSDRLPQGDQSGGDSRRSDSFFSPMDISSEVHFHATREIETTFDRRLHNC
jgi:hypothetical protein